MTATLKKLEASESGLASTVAPNFAPERDRIAEKTKHEPEDRRQFTIPSDGWVNGPGRFAHATPGFSLARG